MEESQNIEWKETWRDEYIKWIGGFANASGGKLFIGINDKGEVTGLTDAKKLLEDIPNKVRDILGIVVDVDLKTSLQGNYLEITVEAYPYPVSYKGQYHYRSGSTKQELKGAALDKFLLNKQGRRWDAVPIPHVSANDLSLSAFDFFRTKAFKSNRLTEEIVQESNDILLEKLHLNEGKFLKRAAILLFHPDPEKYVTGAFVKIGYFRTDDDLLFQDEIHGHLFEQIEKALDLLRTKYLKALISYEGIQRIEELPFPEAALREALLNAIAHKDYSSGIPIQISVYADKIIFWNEGTLPENWTVENLKQKHASRPFNPSISTALFRTGYIEQWGRGTIRIINECIRYGLPAPVFDYDFASVMLEIKQKIEKGTQNNAFPAKDVGEMSEKMSEKVLELIRTNFTITTAILAKELRVSTKTIERALKTLKEEKKIERMGGDRGGYWKVIPK
jgi:ATP-dependent DNA helicase RecG